MDPAAAGVALQGGYGAWDLITSSDVCCILIGTNGRLVESPQKGNKINMERTELDRHCAFMEGTR